jgi:hypothetical protein
MPAPPGFLAVAGAGANADRPWQPVRLADEHAAANVG